MKLLLPATTAQRFSRLKAPLGAQLWYGPAGIGKYTAAIALARRLNCQKGAGEDACHICRQIDNGNYPDVITLRPEGSSIGIEQIRRLGSVLMLKPYQPNAYRLIIIDGADNLTAEAQNALLKSVEEPSANTSFILLSSDPQVLAGTLKSRCQTLSFSPLSSNEIEHWLVDSMRCTEVLAANIALLANGLPGRAAALSNNIQARDAHGDSIVEATGIIKASLFDRLAAVRRLHDAKVDLASFGRLVVEVIRQASRSSSPDTACLQLNAAANYVKLTQGGVSSRTAIEALCLEL